MASVVADRVKETTTTTGTGTLNLGGTSTGYQTFVNGIGNGNKCAYLIDDGNGNWEVTWGQVASGTPATITRGTLIKSSTGSRISFSAGTKTVTVVPAAELLLWPMGSAALVEGSIASATTTDLGTVETFRAQITGTTTITSFGTQPNALKWVRFAAALTLTHNATTLILSNGATRTTAAGEIALFASDASGNWTELCYASPVLPGASWTPSDASGAGLSLTSLSAYYTRKGDEVRCFAKIQYPATANGSANFIGGLPFTVKNADYAQGGGVLTYCNETTAKYAMVTKNSTGFAIYDSSGNALTNATLSGDTLWVSLTFMV